MTASEVMIDWKLYEQQVLSLFEEAVEAYISEHSDREESRVFQISIWTDPQMFVSAVNFETLKHGLQENEKGIKYFEQHGRSALAEQLRAQGYNDNPADFLYPEFRTTEHTFLCDAGEVGQLNADAADPIIEATLMRIVDSSPFQDLIRRLPREPEVWVGISSPAHWYDHVRRVS